MLPQHTAHTDVPRLWSSSISCSSDTPQIITRTEAAGHCVCLMGRTQCSHVASEYKDLRALVFESMQKVSEGTCVHIQKEPVSALDTFDQANI